MQMKTGFTSAIFHSFFVFCAKIKHRPAMRKKQEWYVSNSILHVQTGKWHETVISIATLNELKNLSSTWLFDWVKESKQLPFINYQLLRSQLRLKG